MFVCTKTNLNNLKLNYYAERITISLRLRHKKGRV